jgi:hypothetical protein
MNMKTAGFIFAAILCGVIMLGTVMAAANAGMTQIASSSVVTIL